ncbi:hypothetical protein A7985_18495 [Pseudoalteromonas luteoviolacea]|uniref:DUF2897 family protein n=2 Tax=Pseudoalteromonas luteoviolacea TaxID=43657 RepID=A0A1C0TMA1_9GAMM|nr:DUF2897 family protein [Pseudoalteromonas luteoviolacea]MBQ4812373.1 DUF2897 family protein [Pseudoalteromonas luteoviolacea]OCQ19892.1 hypothetical protein A7985_18495 [Pseudoalteromonas luteoviolacea]
MGEEKLETWQIILIIVAVLGYIIGNITLLKYATKFNVKNKLDKQIKNEEVSEEKPEDKQSSKD